MARSEFEFESRLVPLILDFARSKAVDVAALAARFGLSEEVVKAQPGRQLVTTSASVPVELMEALAEQLQDAHVGLSMVGSVQKGSYGVAEFLVRAAPTLKPAFENLVRFTGLFAPSQTFQLEVDDEVRLHHFFTARPSVLGRHLNEYTTGLMRRTLAAMAPQVPVVRVWFTNPRPPSLERLHDALGADVTFEFEQPTNGFSVALEALATPVSSGEIGRAHV
jgi:hypothetical protein